MNVDNVKDIIPSLANNLFYSIMILELNFEADMILTSRPHDINFKAKRY